MWFVTLIVVIYVHCTTTKLWICVKSYDSTTTTKSMKQILSTIVQVFHSRYLFKGKINLPKIFCKIFFLIYLVKCLTQHTPPLSREPVLWADGDGECDRASSKSSSSSLSCSLSVGDYNVMKDKISTVASFVF